MSVSVNVIEHITDDAYNRQEEFREKDQISLLERGKTKGEKKQKPALRFSWVNFIVVYHLVAP